MHRNMIGENPERPVWGCHLPLVFGYRGTQNDQTPQRKTQMDRIGRFNWGWKLGSDCRVWGAAILRLVVSDP